MIELRYQRILLKLSGEAFGGSDPCTRFSIPAIDRMGREIAIAHRAGVKIGIVVGGGNIARGADLSGIEQPDSDYMGMLATIQNGVALKNVLTSILGDESESHVRLMTALPVAKVCEDFSQGRLERHLDKGRVVIIAGGTGDPYRTTDSAAALRSFEMGADALLMAKNGIESLYDADPRENPEARPLFDVSYEEALGLRAMDHTALTECRNQKMPIIVFSIDQPGRLRQIVSGDDCLRTLIH